KEVISVHQDHSSGEVTGGGRLYAVIAKDLSQQAEEGKDRGLRSNIETGRETHEMGVNRTGKAENCASVPMRGRQSDLWVPAKLWPLGNICGQI
ncbi:MAG: hypothetical protein ABSG91_24355, partial [Syntrophobacteraceae bacterium]